MRKNILAEKLRAGEIVLGLCNTYPASGIIEGMCHGWDFVWIDGQHGEMSYDSILHALQAAAGVGIETVVRVPGHEHGVLGVHADLCPSAILVPMINTVEEARHVVAGLRFPPLGVRSYGGRRVIDVDGRDYYRERELMVIAQTETLEAVENAAEIAAVEGIDGLFFGPDDMRVRMDIPVNTPMTEHPRLKEALRQTVDAARGAGKFTACVAVTPEAVEMVVGMGYRMVVGGGDIRFLRTASAEALTVLRQAAEGSVAEGGSRSGGSVY